VARQGAAPLEPADGWPALRGARAAHASALRLRELSAGRSLNISFGRAGPCQTLDENRQQPREVSFEHRLHYRKLGSRQRLVRGGIHGRPSLRRSRTLRLS
jgi:hypothetical protein